MSFDAFDPTQVQEPTDTFYGEIIMHRGFQGVRLYDLNEDLKGWQEYDPNDPFHKQAMATPQANGKNRRVHTIYEFQHYPMGAGFETYPIQAPSWADDWKIFLESARDATGLNGNDIYPFLKEMTNGGKFFEYETPVTRTYTGDDGSTKSVRTVKALRVFASQQECQDAYDEAHGIDGEAKMMDTPTVEALPKEQALGFIPALAGQVSDLDELQAKIDTMPMLANLDVTDADVIAAAVKANAELMPF